MIELLLSLIITQNPPIVDIPKEIPIVATETDGLPGEDGAEGTGGR